MTNQNQDKPTYTTKWVQVLPKIGADCPVCQVGMLQKGKWGGVICFECRNVWKISKFPAQSAKAGAEKIVTLEDKKHQEIMKGLREIYKEIKKLQT